MRSSLVFKLLCLVGTVGVTLGFMVASMSAAAPAGRLAGANLALVGGVLLVAALRTRRRASTEELVATVGAAHFFDRSVADQPFWPDGL